MPKLDDLMPAELRDRLRRAEPMRRPVSAPVFTDDGAVWVQSQTAAETVAVLNEAAAWRKRALEGGEVIASGWPAGKVGIGPRQALAAEAWAALRYDRARNAAVDRATKAVVATGLDFELVAPKRGPGRPKVAAPRAADDDAVRLLLRDAPGMTREEFRRRAKAAMPGAKAIEVDAAWQKARKIRREIHGENRRISNSRQRV